MSLPDPATDDDLADLNRRLRATRRVPQTPGTGWDRGVDAGYLDELVTYWARDYDWRAHEKRIRDLPWADAGSLRVVHRRAERRSAPAVVLLHGWPDSVLRFERLLPLLDDIHVVVPALPGFPFAGPASRASASVATTATLVAEAMAALGYERYTVSAGDFGGHVAEHLAAAHPGHVHALHLTNLAPWHAADPADLTDVEREYVTSLGGWRAAEGGYLAVQTTKPHTLAVGLGDSPAGLAAWIVEKLHGWSDRDGAGVESVFPRDDLLTWVTAYWLSASIGTSFGPYIERSPRPGPITTPAFLSLFPRDAVIPPREFAQRFLDVAGWHEHARGGHFAAWECPEEYAADLRGAVRS